MQLSATEAKYFLSTFTNEDGITVRNEIP